MRAFQTFILLGIMHIAAAQESHTISGSISDAGTGEDLIGVSIVDKLSGSGTVTNVYGFYSLTLPAGEREVSFSYIGYESVTQKIDLSKSQTLNVSLETSTVDLKEVVVKADQANDNITSTDIGVVKMDMKDLNAVPVLFGEKDIMKSIQLMPGVSSAGDGNSGFYVRGGSTDQNMIFLDEAPVYNPSHLLGFFSVFNSDAVKDVTLYKSGVPAEFGGRSSSVMDVRMNEGNMKKYGFTGGIGLLSARLTAEGPIVKDKVSFIVSGRRTWFDLFLPLLLENGDQTTLYFYDINAKINWKINDKNRLFASGYFGRDVFSFDSFLLNWGNGTGTLRWNHVFNEKLFSNTTFVFSNYDYEIGVSSGGLNFSIESGIRDYNIKQDLTYYLNPKNTLKFGLNGIFHTYEPGKLNSEDGFFNSIVLDKAYATESALYIANEQKILKGFTARYGLRFSMFNRIGEATIYEFDEQNNVVDSTQYAPGEHIITYVGLEPRLSLTYAFNRAISLKASYHRMYQYNHLLSNSTASTPTDLWIPSGTLIKPQFSDQFSLGYFHNFLNDEFELSLEGYYKQMYNVVDYEDGAEIYLNDKVESELAFGKGRSYGAELLIRRKKGKISGWISYTLSRTENLIDGINDNTWFSTKQDRTHDFAIVLNYRPTERWTISANWVYYTGNAVTFPSGVYQMEGNLVPLYTERNGYRMPDYHRLDFGVTLHGKKKKRFTSDWTLSIYNVYARENAFSISFQESESNPGTTEAVQLALFSIVPSITWNFNF